MPTREPKAVRYREYNDGETTMIGAILTNAVGLTVVCTKRCVGAKAAALPSAKIKRVVDLIIFVVSSCVD